MTTTGNKRRAVKLIDLGELPPDDPIYSRGLEISPGRSTTSNERMPTASAKTPPKKSASSLMHAAILTKLRSLYPDATDEELETMIRRR